MHATIPCSGTSRGLVLRGDTVGAIQSISSPPFVPWHTWSWEELDKGSLPKARQSRNKVHMRGCVLRHKVVAQSCTSTTCASVGAHPCTSGCGLWCHFSLPSDWNLEESCIYLKHGTKFSSFFSCV